LGQQHRQAIDSGAKKDACGELVWFERHRSSGGIDLMSRANCW
jgi:hypothetical protein